MIDERRHLGPAFVNVRLMSVQFVACLASTLVTSGSAGWTFSVSIYDYADPNGLNASGGWCDPFHTPCDPYFSFCLRPKDYDLQNDECPLGAYTTSSQYFGDTNKINFVVPGYIIPGVSNPLIFSGASWTGGFQLVIRIWDYDPIGSDDLIDSVVINAELNAESGSSVIQYGGSSGSAVMSLRYTLSCDRNFYSSTCDVYCRSRDDAAGHFTCDSFGNKVCLSGYQNATASCTTPTCTPGCSPIGGYCIAPNECRCNPGWSGSTCYQCVTSSGCAHGHCNTPNQCICDQGYSGSLCKVDNDVCGHNSPCHNGGTCTNSGPDAYQCACPPGWTGSVCEVMKNESTDPCVTALCMDGETCKGPTCPCPVDFTGPDCTSRIDDCMGVVCQNQGTCVDRIGTYQCRCRVGFSGRVCEIDIDDCDPNPCYNGGTCVDGEDSFHCNCVDGFGGYLCKTHLHSERCLHGGTYVSEEDGFKCLCPAGYAGALCEMGVCTNGTCTIPVPAAAAASSVLGITFGAATVLLIIAAAMMIAMGVICLLHKKRHNRKFKSCDQMPTGFPIHNPLYDSQSSPANGNDLSSFVSVSLHVPSHAGDDDYVNGTQPNDQPPHYWNGNQSNEQPPHYWNAVCNSSPSVATLYDRASTVDVIYSTIAEDNPVSENVGEPDAKNASSKAPSPGTDSPSSAPDSVGQAYK